MQIWV